VATRRLSRVALLGLGLYLAGSGRAGAWGFEGHRLVSDAAVLSLPEPLGRLFSANAAFLAEHAIDPDLWRAAGAQGENENHFFDADAFGPARAVPRLESAHLEKDGPDARKRGRLPWRLAEAYRDLVAAFEGHDPQMILARAAELGHYVADAHVPLHATLNYDGQLTGQTGIHARWESGLVNRYRERLQAALRPAPPEQVADPVELAFQALDESLRDSRGLLEADHRAVGPGQPGPDGEVYDDGYYARLYEQEGTRLVRRLSAAASRLASLWWSAWQQAGAPELPLDYRVPYVRHQSKLVLVSLDGASAPWVDDAVARGLMPRLFQIRASGATARGALTTLPCKTAAAHAALFTGAWSPTNGIGGNHMPLPGGSIMESVSGYASSPLLAEPLWVTAARQGLDTAVVSATQIFPFAPYLEERRFGADFGRRLVMLDGYQPTVSTDGVVSSAERPLFPVAHPPIGCPPHVGEVKGLELEVAGVAIHGLALDDPADPVDGLDTLCLSTDRTTPCAARLKPRPAAGASVEAFAHLDLARGGETMGIHLRLFELAPDGSRLLLYHTAARSLRASRPELATAAVDAAGSFVGNGAVYVYQRGLLGPPLWEGGDGTAEERYLETLALVARQLDRLNAFMIERGRFDVLVTYLPAPDEFLHLWLGYLDPHLPGHDPALAARLRPFVDRGYVLVDDYLERLAARLGPDTVLAVAADHGLVGVSRVVRPNVALAAAGLLTLDASGAVDLSHTRALYFPGNQGYVLVNGTGHPSGIVADRDLPGVRRAVEEALLGIRDPTTGQAVVLAVRPADPAADPATGGTSGGDLYLSLATGYTLAPDWQGDLVSPITPRGEHMLDPSRAEMHAAFSLAGPGVQTASDLGTIRLIDVAPTLCALLGIDPPRQAVGRVLEAALARPAR
jgi:predicted AlkP superfamily phosphohydrolase/phosphomutase